jgi:hypothetical protein
MTPARRDTARSTISMGRDGPGTRCTIEVSSLSRRALHRGRDLQRAKQNLHCGQVRVRNHRDGITSWHSVNDATHGTKAPYTKVLWNPATDV